MTITSAYVSTVGPDRTIVLPESVPVGVQVAVVLLPDEKENGETMTRNGRFQVVMDAIRAAMESNFTEREPTDKELDEMIAEARKAAKT